MAWRALTPSARNLAFSGASEALQVGLAHGVGTERAMMQALYNSLAEEGAMPETATLQEWYAAKRLGFQDAYIDKTQRAGDGARVSLRGCGAGGRRDQLRSQRRHRERARPHGKAGAP